MSTTKKTGAKKKRPKKLVVLRLPGPHKGKIDPREIRRAVVAVRTAFWREEAEAKARAEANGKGHSPEAE
jgi:hypothetical protein